MQGVWQMRPLTNGRNPDWKRKLNPVAQETSSLVFMFVFYNISSCFSIHHTSTIFISY